MAWIPPFLSTLGLDGSADERAIRRAYAVRLKVLDQEKEAAQFQALRQAYESAMEWVRRPKSGLNVQPLITFQAANPARVPDPPAEVTPEPDPPPVKKTHKPSPAEMEDAAPGEDRPSFFREGPEVLARAVYMELMEKGSRWNGRQDPLQLLLDIKGAIEACMADPRLVPLDARHHFEGMIAEFLAKTQTASRLQWFQAAARIFEWRKDRRRLECFGGAGRKLNVEIDAGGLDGFKPSQPQPARPNARPSGTFGRMPWWAIGLVLMLMMRVVANIGDSGRGTTPPAIRPMEEAPAKSTSKSIDQMGLLFAPSTRTSPSTSKAMGDNPLDQARSHMAAGDYDAALRRLSVAKKNKANAREAWHMSGIVLQVKQDDARAVKEFTEALRLDPTKAATWYARGFSLARMGRTDEALADYTKALSIDGYNAAILQNRGKAWLRKREFDKAFDDFSAAIRISPTYAEAYVGRGRVFAAEKNSTKAMADFREAIRLDSRLEAEVAAAMQESQRR